MNETLMEKLRRIQHIVCDFDGVLTDGTIAYDGQGRPFRWVHARDVTALTLWHIAGGSSAIVSGLGSQAMEVIAAQWRCAERHMWVKDKARVLREMGARLDIPLDRMAFLGDDIIDVAAMKSSGLAVAVGDAMEEVKDIADHVTLAPGGKGALRELVYAILSAQGRLDVVIEAYCTRKDESEQV